MDAGKLSAALAGTKRTKAYLHLILIETAHYVCTSLCLKSWPWFDVRVLEVLQDEALTAFVFIARQSFSISSVFVCTERTKSPFCCQTKVASH